jgi:hypothetical protein
MAVHVRRTASIALALIVCGILLPLGYAHWLRTRTFVALEMPVSLSPGTAHSPEFTVNLPGWYQIGTDVDSGFPFTYDCGFGGRPPLLKTRSTIYRNGRVLEQIDGSDRFLGHFYAEPRKHYRFDLEILTNAGCLNKGHPTIFVRTSSAYYEYLQDVLLILSGLLFLSGVGMLLFSIAVHAEDRATPPSCSSPLDGPRHYRYPSRRKLPLKARFVRLPSFALLYAVILGTVLTPGFLILLGANRQSTGFVVHLSKLVPPTGGAQVPLLVVALEKAGAGSPPHLYLNSRPMAWEALGSAIKTELKYRAEWAVYVEADPYVEWGDAVRVIGIVRGAGVKVVFVTTPHAG